MEIFMNILLMLAGVGVFIAGMKMMSNGIEQNAGGRLKKMFKKISGNDAVGYGVGVGVTAIVQSSSATSVMTIGLANANIISTRQGASIILGAKVGTTITAFIFAISGLSSGGFSIGVLFSACAFIGVIIGTVAEKDNTKKIALFLTGFGMLFLGLEVMGSALGDTDGKLGQALEVVFGYEIMKNPVILMIIGIILTFIIQSSSAASGIFITLLKTGVLSSADQSFFLMMGANIGTCSDGIMAAFGSNASGKRLAVFHIITSTAGAVFFALILGTFRTPISNMFNRFFIHPEWSLAVFNMSYNLIYTLALLPFIDSLIKFTERFFTKNKKTKAVKRL